MEKFKEWSGLKINLGKTYLTIFGKQYKKPRLIDEFQIKWFVEFKLLGIILTLHYVRCILTMTKLSIRSEKSLTPGDTGI